MHSPFVFDFVLNVLNNKSGYRVPKEIEILRKQLLSDDRLIEVNDLGAGSRSQPGRERSVKNIARSATKPERLAAILYRTVRHYQPLLIIELGTSLGITTSCFSKANENALIHTIEGSAEIAAIANENFKNLQCSNIHLHTGNFDEQLPIILSNVSDGSTSDGDKHSFLGFIDGNHQYEPTMRYFNWFLEKINENSILIFDDIHWSREMEHSWEKIKAHPEVMYTIDIFYLGFVFFRKDFRVKQNFSIRYR